MNLTIETQKYGLLQFFSLVADLVIAASAGLVYGGWQGAGASEPRARGGASVAPTVTTLGPTVVEEVFYLVASDAGVQAVRQAEQDIEAMRSRSNQHLARNVRILTIATPQDEEAALAAVADLTWDAEGVRVITVDLRYAR